CLKRVPAHIIGDGTSTIQQLVAEKNKSRKGPVLKALKLDSESDRNIKRLGYSFDSVPEKDETVFLRSNANISGGGDSYENTKNISPNVIKQIEKAVKSIAGLHVCGVDAL